MLVTVAICTWNRANLLDQTLDRMTLLEIPSGVRWELLVVNNNCSDHTDAVLEKFADRLPLRRLFEPNQGHCFARNCAINAAAGDLLIWTDDDVLVEPDWLAQYVRAANEWPTAGAFGGAVDAWLEADPPQWFKNHWGFIKGLFVIREHYQDEFPVVSDVTPVGANMGVRMEHAKNYRFDESLGRVGSTLSGGDDCEWLERLSEAGVQFAWVGSAKVKHFIPKERLTEDFLRRWFEGAGRTSVRMNGIAESTMMFGVPRWMWKKQLLSKLATNLLQPVKNQWWFFSFRRHHMMRGMIQEIREQTRKLNSTP